MSYKAKYMKARDRYYEHVTKNEELKTELSVVNQDVQELREEIKMLINTILGVAPEFEPSLTSDDAAEEEALDQVLDEFQYGRSGTPKNGRMEVDEENDNGYYNHHQQQRGEELDTRSVRNNNSNGFSSPHHRRQRVRQPISSNSNTQRTRNTSSTTNGRHSTSSRLKYDETAVDNAQSDLDSRDYGDNVDRSPYSGSAQGEDIEPEGGYYSGEPQHTNTTRGNPASSSQRYRSSVAANQRVRAEEQHHPYPTSSRQSRTTGNGHHRPSSSTKNNGDLTSPSPEPTTTRYSNSSSSHGYPTSRTYRN